MSINSNEAVSDQYATSENLDIRIRLHAKYSTNRQGFNTWIVTNYDIRPNMRILELGCGTGVGWKGNVGLLRDCQRVVFTDFSPAILSEAEHTIGAHDNVAYEVADAQDLPYPDRSFDIVIANMMLYHVPHLEVALSEIRRVLREGGTLYTATFGERSLASGINRMLGIDSKTDGPFTLQNGRELLQRYFSSVERRDYEDGLRITEKDDLIEYIRSLKDMTEWSRFSAEELSELLGTYEHDGVISLPKEYGMFVSKP